VVSAAAVSKRGKQLQKKKKLKPIIENVSVHDGKSKRKWEYQSCKNKQQSAYVLEGAWLLIVIRNALRGMEV